MSEPMLPDGTYDVFVVDADDAGDGTTSAIELAVLAGEQKGAIVRLASILRRDALDLLGTPGTLVVADGAPALTLEG